MKKILLFLFVNLLIVNYNDDNLLKQKVIFLSKICLKTALYIDDNSYVINGRIFEDNIKKLIVTNFDLEEFEMFNLNFSYYFNDNLSDKNNANKVYVKIEYKKSILKRILSLSFFIGGENEKTRIRSFIRWNSFRNSIYISI